MPTLLEISIAIHYHCHPDDYGNGNGDNNFNAPAVQDAIRRFLERGLLRSTSESSKPHFEANRDAIGTYIQALCDVPLPIQQWVIPNKAA